MKIIYRLLLSTVTIISCAKNNDDDTNNDNSQEPVEIVETKEAITGSRITWDFTTKKIISDVNDSGYNGYPRLIELQDSSLLVTYESRGNILVKKSTDGGETWSAPITVAPFSEGVNMATPDVIQLQNGNILITYNPRPSASALPSKKFLIKTILSSDGGLTWHNDQVVYEGDTVFENGVWEPSALQLPSGEIQLYFSNENIYQSSNEQNISLLRSQDNGITWSTEPKITSFRAASRDGMPSPLYLEDQNTIVYSIEDNGINNQFKPYIVRNTIDENWSETVKGNSTNRSYALLNYLDDSEYAGAPYLARLSSGEVLLSYQGTDNRSGSDINNADMKVLVGSNNATNFNRTTVPFIIPQGKAALWSSIAVLEDDTVVALTTTNAFSNNNSSQVWMIKGYIVPELNVTNGTLTIDGETSEINWENNLPVFIGHKGNTQLQANTITDNDNLYVMTKVTDNNISTTSSSIQNNDGVVIYLDPMGKSYVAPGSGVFKIMISASNQIKVFEGFNSTWKVIELPDIETAVSETTNGYIQEIKIPWNSIGGKTNANSRIGFTIELTEKGTASYTETLSSTNKDKPYTWLDLNS
tara:strand:+ start:45310 stop:47067 length:1758 start_codon:yes stop_codon:yes gene_type:complete